MCGTCDTSERLAVICKARELTDAVLPPSLLEPVRKAMDLSTGPGFDRAVASLSRSLRRATQADETAALRAAVAELDIDWHGTKQLQCFYPKATTVYILPPSMDALAKRLRGRKTDDEAEIKVRLENSRKELDHYDLYDHLIVNDDLDAAVADLSAIVATGAAVRPAPSLAEVEQLLSEVVQ